MDTRPADGTAAQEQRESLANPGSKRFVLKRTHTRKRETERVFCSYEGWEPTRHTQQVTGEPAEPGSGLGARARRMALAGERTEDEANGSSDEQATSPITIISRPNLKRSQPTVQGSLTLV
jgi:hypothetical protein